MAFQNIEKFIKMISERGVQMNSLLEIIDNNLDKTVSNFSVEKKIKLFQDVISGHKSRLNNIVRLSSTPIK